MTTAAANSDARCFPLIEIEFDQVREMLSPVLGGGGGITLIERVDGGLVNTVYRIRLAEGGGSLCLRAFAAGRPAWETERNILARVAAALPVPEVLLAEDGEPHFTHPYLVYRWIEGLTLNECRRQMPPAALLSLAEPLGRLLAGVSGFSFADAYGDELQAAHTRLSSVEALLRVSEEHLQRGLARARLGDALADALWRLLAANAAQLSALDRAACLVHGDLGGRNVIVAPDADGGWRVSGLIDWEEAFSGAALWDVGSLFRYAKRYSENFRRRFEQSYCDAGGTLPEDWWRTSRLLHAIQSVATLNEERELPVVFVECRELVAAVVADWA